MHRTRLIDRDLPPRFSGTLSHPTVLSPLQRPRVHIWVGHQALLHNNQPHCLPRVVSAAAAVAEVSVPLEAPTETSAADVQQQEQDAAAAAAAPKPAIPGEDHHRYDFPDGPAWELVARRPLAGGTLDIIRWEGRRMIRVWLPPGYDLVSAQLAGGLPSLLLHDGQNLFDPNLCMSRTCWQAAESAAKLIASGVLPPFVIIGVDHAGLSRSYEYTPCAPGTGPGGFRQDAAEWPGGGVWDYLERLAEEVMPRVTTMYGLSERASERAMGGSSFGGIATLCAALRYPQVWGSSLVESPSLWIGEEIFLNDSIAKHKGPLPARMFIGMGGKEFSGVRPAHLVKQFPTADARVEGYAQALAEIMQDKGLPESQLEVIVEADASHTESAWASRLPAALTHVCSPWWLRVLEDRHAHLMTTIRKRLRPGCPGVLLVNRARSDTLGECDDLQLVAGFNMDWEVKLPNIELQPTSWRLSQLTAPGETVPAQHASPSDDWWVASFDVPPDAYEMHLALRGTSSQSSGAAPDRGGDSDRVWDNNAGSKFYLPLAPALPPPSLFAARREVAAATGADGAGAKVQPLTAAMQKAQEALSADHQAIANRNGSRTFFSIPETLLAGAPAVLYLNKKRTCFHDQPNVKLHYGWNGWGSKIVAGGAAHVDFKPTCLWRDEGTDWWAAQLNVPESASEMNFAFTNGDWLWDSNNGYNYTATVMVMSGDAVGPVARPREVEHVQELPHGAGTMHILQLAKRDPRDPGYTKQGRWVDEKTVRVWTPPGWSPDLDKAPPGGWPVLYLSDGQNKFEDFLAHQGVSWSVGYQASDLVTSGALPPFLVVGVDSAGPMRSLNYLPYAPGTGAGGFRGDAERWPGGGVAQYMKRVTEEIMPLLQQRFHVAQDPERTAFGGGSFGGVCALYTAMHYPHLFGSILAESPSFWIAEGRFLGDMAAHRGRLPARIFLGCGTREYSATRDHERQDVDELLLHYCCEAARSLEEKGCRPGQGCLRFHVEPEAGHHEGAWKWRFSGAMQYLFSHLWDLQPQPNK